MPSFGILDLPREIRDRIFEFVYPVDKVSVWTLDWLPERAPRFYMFQSAESDFSMPNEDLAPLLVNHQFSAEAMAEFYGSHIFAASPRSLTPFLGRIGDRRDLIRRVETQDVLDEPLESVLQVLALLSTLPALQLVKISYLYNHPINLVRARIDNFEVEALDERVVVKVFCNNYYYIKHVDSFGTEARHMYNDIHTWTRVTSPAGWEEEKLNILVTTEDEW